MADDLRAVIATLPSPPALVGASMGGCTALYAVGTSRGAIASALVLVDVVPRINMEGGKKIGRAPSELQSLMRISYAVFCLKKTTNNKRHKKHSNECQYIMMIQ